MSASQSNPSAARPRAPTRLRAEAPSGAQARSARLGWGWLLVLQAALIASAWWSGGIFDRTSDYVALVVLTVVLVAGVGFLGLAQPRRGKWWLLLPLGAILASILVEDLLRHEALLYPRADRPQRPAYHVLAVASLGVLILGWLTRRRWVRVALPIGAAGLFAAFLATQLYRSPSPIMDTWKTNSEATETFLKGRNPYRQEKYTNIYEQRGSDIKVDYPMLFNYLPGLILHYAASKVLGGDIRWTNLVGIACGVLLFALCVRPHRAGGARGPHVITRAAAVVLFWYHGGQVLVVEQAWPEAWLLVYVGLAAWTWRRSTWVPALALVLALTLKQTAWLCAPFFLVLSIRERRWGLIALVAVGVTAIVLPFFLWDPRTFVENVVLHFFGLTERGLKPRPEALSWSAACLRDAPMLQPLAGWLSYALLAAALGCLVVRLRRCRGAEALLETYKWMLLGLLGLFLFLQQSFFNYYYVVGGLLAFYPCLVARTADDRVA